MPGIKCYVYGHTSAPIGCVQDCCCSLDFLFLASGLPSLPCGSVSCLDVLIYSPYFHPTPDLMISEETGKNQMRPLPGMRTENTAEGEAFYVEDDKKQDGGITILKVMLFLTITIVESCLGGTEVFKKGIWTQPIHGEAGKQLMLMSPAIIDTQLIRETLHSAGRVFETTGQDGEVEGAIWNS